MIIQDKEFCLFFKRFKIFSRESMLIRALRVHFQTNDIYYITHVIVLHSTIVCCNEIGESQYVFLINLLQSPISSFNLQLQKMFCAERFRRYWVSQVHPIQYAHNKKCWNTSILFLNGTHFEGIISPGVVELYP